MTRLTFTYLEIIGVDKTAVVATVYSPGGRPRSFSNFAPSEIPREIYSNQVEEFSFPRESAALAFLLSNPNFRPIRSMKSYLARVHHGCSDPTEARVRARTFDR